VDDNDACGKAGDTGLIKQTKTTLAHDETTRARAEGRTVFVYNFNMPKFAEGAACLSGPLTGCAERIEAIESVGWVLDKTIGRDAAAFVLLFRPI
jgi:hypothetical protein